VTFINFTEEHEWKTRVLVFSSPLSFSDNLSLLETSHCNMYISGEYDG